MNQYKQDRQGGQLPDEASDDDLRAWALNLTHVQGDTNQTAALALDNGGFISNYLDEVHAACT